MSVRYIVFFLILFRIGYANEHVLEQTKAKQDISTVYQKINSLDTFKRFMNDGQKRGYFPKKILKYSHVGPSVFSDINLEFREIMNWGVASKCIQHKSQIILALSDKGNWIECPSNDTLIISGDGNDWVEDPWGNDIFYMGKGDDKVKAGDGSDIFIFDEFWGHDEIKFNSNEVNPSKIYNNNGTYPYRYNSFLIFGKNIFPDDLQWQDDTLVNIKTNDSIKLNSKKVNMLFYEKPQLSNYDFNFIKTKYKSKKITSNFFKQKGAKNVLIKDDLIFISTKNEVLIAQIENNLTFKTINSIKTGARTHDVKIKGDYIYITYNNQELGWIDIYDISDIKNPKFVTKLKFGNVVSNISIDNDRLYVPHGYWNEKQEGGLMIYDIKNPKKPLFLASIKQKRYYPFKIALAQNDLLLLPVWRGGFKIYDTKNPKKLKEIYRQEKGMILSLYEFDKNKIIINYEQKTSLFDMKNLDEICSIDVDTTTQGINQNVAFLRDTILFRATGKYGFDIYDMKNCSLIKRVPMNLPHWLIKIFVLQNNLISFSQGNIYNLDKIFPSYKFKEKIKEKSQKSAKITKELDFSTLSKDKLQALLQKAAYDDNQTLAFKLCSLGADPYLETHSHTSPIEFSVMLGNTKALEAMSKFTIIKTKIQSLARNLKTIKALEKHITINYNKYGCAYLNNAIINDEIEFLKFLDKKFPIQTCTFRDKTPLDEAIKFKSKKVIRYLNTKK